MTEPTRDRDERFRGTFTAAWVKNTEPQEKEVQYAQRLKQGLSLVLYVSPRGTKTWRVTYYNRQGRARTKRLGAYPDLSLKDAYDHAFEFDPAKAVASKDAGTFKTIADDWLVEHVGKKKLRTEYEIRRQLDRYIHPEFGKTPIYEAKRLDVNQFLRKIEKNHGPAQADAILSTMRSIFGWYQVQDDNFTSPIVRGMKRDRRSVAERSRNRILNDEEIRVVWNACGDDGLDEVFGAIVRVLLVTGQRLHKVSTMRHRDVKDGVWTASIMHREKGHIGQVRLPSLVLDILEGMPRLSGNPHMFPASKGDGPFNSFSQRKGELDELLPGVPPWTLHDLRRTARSLMARLSVSRDVAERALGHAIPGVEGVYDRHDYMDEKSDALQRVADHVARILHPPEATNVVPLKKENPRRLRGADQV